MAKKLEIKQIKSSIGYKQNAKKTIEALGIKKMNKPVVHNDTPQIRGMIKSIYFMLEVKEI
tara:strand:+ start:830 stop:1012 length:183 start_codon:yes stop_codon:yes gene_type:complete